MSETGDGPLDRVRAALSEPTRSCLTDLIGEPPLDAGTLARRVRAYSTELAKHNGHIEIVDHWTGNEVAWKCLALLEKLDDADPEGRALIQAAVLYFIKQDDAEHDIESPVGFDDDLEVVDAVARELGFVEILNRQGA